MIPDGIGAEPEHPKDDGASSTGAGEISFEESTEPLRQNPSCLRMHREEGIAGGQGKNKARVATRAQGERILMAIMDDPALDEMLQVILRAAEVERREWRQGKRGCRRQSPGFGFCRTLRSHSEFDGLTSEEALGLINECLGKQSLDLADIGIVSDDPQCCS